ncbi:GDSL esterase/lipase [Hibiscus syriacus]|uniref:GDSL esterase/lipase n=1 Tax=Hibiscus syriacus TaxID=106335 RepID=A0A6A2Y2G7_HIBSY|nr:GDSL esterase/lipase At4g10955-like [Hibiscus syriacus]KAE8662184.1 GDSL esterase/lipase [Hibiscus syriacus]
MEENKVKEEGKPLSERHIFCLSGPTHLTTVDWNNFNHRRSVAASLVRGVYILEYDRQLNRRGSQAHAPPWWDSFNFRLIRPLVDDADNSIFGAVYELMPFTSDCNHSVQNAPDYVVAFRGTINKPDTMSRDLRLDIRCVRNRLHETSRYQLAMQAVWSIIDAAAGTSRIWLAGHSLGSAISLLVGKNVTKMGYSVEAYLFNPPFPASIEIIKDGKLKDGIRITTSLLKAGLATAKGHYRSLPPDGPFMLLSKWVPYLFVNPADPICSGYIGYFEHRKKMEEFRAGKIERIATLNSLLKRDSEPLHLLLSANLTINSSKSPDFKRAHGIQQWWDPSFDGQSELHEYK